MKWKCTFQPEEEDDATADLEELRRRHPGAKVRKSAAHPPQKCVYLTTKKDGSPCGTKDRN